jgi:hypothetical protein
MHQDGVDRHNWLGARGGYRGSATIRANCALAPSRTGRSAGSHARHNPMFSTRLNLVSYKGFAITARTFQIRGSGRWTLDLLIGRHGDLRAFSGPGTYPTEESAITGCCEFGRRIIDGRVRDCSVDDLSETDA